MPNSLNIAKVKKNMDIMEFLYEEYENTNTTDTKDITQCNEEYDDSENGSRYSTNPPYYSTQREALESIHALDLQKILFKYGMYKFGVADNVNHLIELSNNSKLVKKYYEVCNREVKLFADLEKYNMSNYDMIVIFKELLKDVFNELRKTNSSFAMFNPKKCVFLVDDSDKHSMHFIYNNDMCFNSNNYVGTDHDKKNDSQRLFWLYVASYIKNNSKYENLISWNTEKRSNGKDYLIEGLPIDLKVYSSMRPMRMMHSCKDKDPRTFYPCKLDITNKRCILMKRKELSKKYLINDYSLPKKIINYNIKYPIINSYIDSRKSFCLTDIKNTILEGIPNVRIGDIKERMVILKNDCNKARECLISGHIHDSNNSYVVIKDKGLYFYCHREECSNNPTEDLEDCLDSKGGYCFHRFHNIKIIVKKIIQKIDLDKEIKDKMEDMVYSDINYLRKEFKTEIVECKKKGIITVLTDQDRSIFLEFLKHTMIYINDGDKESFFIKKRRYNDKSKDYSISWEISKADNIFKNKDTIAINGAKWSKSCKHYTKGKIINYLSTRVDLQTGDFLISRYNEATFIPYFKYKLEIRDCFNMFNGWHLMKYFKETNAGSAEDEFSNTLIFNHIENNICNGNKELIEYTHNWISHLIQHPYEKPEVCLVLYSKGGAGKDRFNAFLGNLIGRLYHSVYRTLDAFTTNFNTMNMNKLLCVFNEVSDRSSRKKHDILKEIITAENERIEPKGVDATTFPCFKRYIINTNYRDVIRMEADDRRYVLYSMNCKQIGNRPFFTALSKEIINKDILICAFNYYGNRDITKFDVRDIPTTVYKKNQINMNIKSSYLFMIQIYRLDCTDSDLANKLYKYLVIPKLQDSDKIMDDDESEQEMISIALSDPKGCNFEFKKRDLYKLYKFYCEEEDLFPCKPNTFTQDLITLGLGNGSFQFSISGSIKKIYIRGYKINHNDLKKPLESVLCTKLDI